MNSKMYLKTLEPDLFLDKDRNGKGYVCPSCDSGSGKNGTGLSRDPNNNTSWKCWNCGFYGDITDLVKERYKLDSLSEAFKKACEIYGLDPSETYEVNKRTQKETNNPPVERKNYSEYYEAAIRNNDYSYLKGRGISEGVQRLFRIGYDPEWTDNGLWKNATPRIIIPLNEYSYLARYIGDNPNIFPNPKMMNKGGNKILFNTSVLHEEEPVFVVEGEIDCMSLYEIGLKALALGTTSNWKKLIEFINSHKIKAPLILMLDSDNSGNENQKKLVDQLGKMNIPFTEATLPNGYDPNDFLIKDREGFRSYCLSLKEEAEEKKRELIERELEAMKNEYNANELLDYFRNIKDQEGGYEAKTGFKCLDDLNQNLYGGFHEGLYIIGAISSLGKTTFCLQLADQIAERGKDVIFFSLEQSKYELMSKSISRNTYIEAEARGMIAKDYAQENYKILSGRQYKDIKQTGRIILEAAIKRYSESAKNLYIYEGRYEGERLSVSHIKSIVSKHIERTGNKPVIFIDYLQILAPVDPRSTDKQNTDIAVFELKELSREYGIPVVAISSFNRESYLEPVSMTSFKESGAVEYSSDILFGLQYSGMDYIEGEGKEARNKRIRTLNKENGDKKGKKDPVLIELKCLKNRNGRTFSKAFRFIHAFNIFEEIDFDPDRDIISRRDIL